MRPRVTAALSVVLRLYSCPLLGSAGPLRGVVLSFVVDAEDCADGGKEIGDADGALDYGGTLAVCAAYDLAASDTTADEDAAPSLGPAVAPAAGALGG